MTNKDASQTPEPPADESFHVDASDHHRLVAPQDGWYLIGRAPKPVYLRKGFRVPPAKQDP